MSHEKISQVFSQSVSVLKKRKQTVGVDINVDGTKIKVNAADDQTYTKEDLAMRHEKLENEIQEYLRRGIELDKEEDSLYGKDNAGDEIDESELNRTIEEIKKARKKRQREES